MSSKYEIHMPPMGGGGGGGGGQTDHFAPKYLVGNVPAGDPNLAQAAPFVYIPDIGDGSGIALALTQPNGPGDVWVRPGTYNLNNGMAGPLVVPPGVLVRGAGATTLILCRPSGDQGAFVLGANASLRDLSISVPASNAGSVASVAVVRSVDASSVRNLLIAIVTAAGGVLADAIRLEGSSTIVEGCKISGTAPAAVVLRGIETVGQRHDLRGNTISLVGSAAVGVSHGADRSRVGDNEVIAALPFSLAGANNVMLGNLCEGAVGIPILNIGLGNEIAHNVIV